MPMKTAITAAFMAAFAVPALAENYPVAGRWGQSASSEKGAIECHGRRVIDFKGNQRTDSKGGVPALRNVSVRPDGTGFRIVDEFSTGQITNGRTTFTLRKIDDNRIELNFQPGGLLKLQRCK